MHCIMDEAQTLIAEIEDFCRRGGWAESTFGRLAVNDGKFVSRIRGGGRVTTRTMERVRTFIRDQPLKKPVKDNGRMVGEAFAPVNSEASKITTGEIADSEMVEKFGTASKRAFRFYDNRQKYLMFINTCSEKWVTAERVGMELAHLHPSPPALRVFDAGMGDGTVLSRVMRDMHRRFSTMPFFVVGKEISLEDTRISLLNLSDRLAEHPATVQVVTNLYYTEAPRLKPQSMEAAAALNWQEVALTGTTAHEFDEQIRSLQQTLSHGWQVRQSEKTGNPLYVRPSVLVLYREDQKFLLDRVIPQPGENLGNYDLLIVSQPYRLRNPIEFKVDRVLSPLADSIAPGGRMLVVQSCGGDPGLEIIQRMWPGENPFTENRHVLLKLLKSRLAKKQRDLNFNAYSDHRAVFRYDMHTLPSEVRNSIGTSTLLAAWNAAAYVGQIDDERLDEAIASREYLDATSEVLRKHGGLWFYDESFVISRRRA